MNTRDYLSHCVLEGYPWVEVISQINNTPGTSQGLEGEQLTKPTDTSG